MSMQYLYLLGKTAQIPNIWEEGHFYAWVLLLDIFYAERGSYPLENGKIWKPLKLFQY
ncbi:hypothetical protein OROGR_023158 [Orobanche gracilis]